MNTLRKLPEKFNICREIDADFLLDAPLSALSTFKVGGNAEILISPRTSAAFAELLSYFETSHLPYTVLGGGSNVVICDSGIEHAVISTRYLNTVHVSPLSDGSVLVECGAGVTIDTFIQFCLDNSLTGAENFAGLPGSVGGAVFMNARCYEKSVSDMLHSAVYYEKGSIFVYNFSSADWDYKKSPFQSTKRTILSAFFKLSQGEKCVIEQKCATLIEDRTQKGHFRYPSAGSVFKNNRLYGKPSGKIIDEAGLRGFCIGGAQVAPWHGNFIINTGGASAADIKNLTVYIHDTVLAASGFNLETEIIFIGN